ncbi:hypothetical protein Q9966_011696 [Columba livia]|nr:hypothetical protein Q9966_011696 [Columba livia]
MLSLEQKGCVGEPCSLNSSSQPSGHAHQYLTHYKSRGLGISVGDRVAQDSWPLPPASAVLCTTGYSHSTRDTSSGGRYQKQLWHRRKSSSRYLILIAKDEMLLHINLCKCLVVFCLLVVVSDGVDMKSQWELQ